jgi:hypothetical protein
VSRILSGLLSLSLAGFAVPISDQPDLPQRHNGSDCGAKDHADEAQQRLPHRSSPRLSGS